MEKYYINITNKCQYECPYCCMYSSPENNGFMSFETLYDIIEHLKRPTIVQLEGGEPLMHPNIILFLEYLASKELVKEIVIDTNSVLLDLLIDNIVDIAERCKKLITIKPSYNFYLIGKDRDLLKRLKLVVSACEFLKYIRFEINVRGYQKEELEVLCEDIGDMPHNAHLFNKYGRASTFNVLEEPYITPQYDTWQLIAHDGKFFGNNLKARSEYEHAKISTNS